MCHNLINNFVVRSEYLFNFDNTFEIHDDIEVLKRMGMAFGLEKNECSDENLKKAVGMMPRALEPYILELAGKGSILQHSLSDHSSSSMDSIYSNKSTLSGVSLVDVKYKTLAQSPLASPLTMTSQSSNMLDIENSVAPRYISASVRQPSLTSYTRESPMLDEMYSCVDSNSGRSSPLIVN